MTKRTADEALIDRAIAGCDAVVRSKELKQSPSPSIDDDADAGAHAKNASAHRISLINSESSCSIAAAAGTSVSSYPPVPAANIKSLHRTVTSLSGSSLKEANTEADQKYAGTNSITDLNGSRLTRFINARILQRDGSLCQGSLIVSPSTGLIVGMRTLDTNGKLVIHGHGHEQTALFDDKFVDVVDCVGNILSPGFIDIQLNGAYGVDFSNDGNSSNNSEKQSKKQEEGLATRDVLHVAQRLVETGITSFCPTMISSSSETYRRILPLIGKARGMQQRAQSGGPLASSKEVGANILGMHLEGPFFAPSKSGAHDSQHIIAPTKGLETVQEVYGMNQEVNGEGRDSPRLEDVDIITLAPELDGALDAIQSATKSNGSIASNSHSVVISCGHTEATYDDGIEAISSGATLLTHLYNAMNPFHHRKPGLVGLLSSEAKLARMDLQRPYFSMIVDGIHVHEAAVCMAYQAHPQGCILVTDAMSAMGLGDGEHMLGNMKVSIKGDRATLSGTDTLAGSVVSMDTCVKRFKQFTGK